MHDSIQGARRRRAVVLFNLGGPDSMAAVRPFLLNLFRDPAILRVPPFVRVFLARFIAWRRVKPARVNYALMGGKSPLLELTRQQAEALDAALAEDPAVESRSFIAMRYWHPFSAAVVRDVAAWRPDEIVLVPLYPQFSTTTTGSSLADWREQAARAGLVAPVTSLCCWHSDPAYVAATAAIIQQAYDAARATLPAATGLRVLFSAHGLPESIVKRGDPYQYQIERSVAAIRKQLRGVDDAGICYQSRATPQQWLTPSTDDEVAQAGRDGVALLVVPIAFVSDHSETLVELDLEYRELAKHAGVPGYFRAPVQNSDPAFIAALAGLVRQAAGRGPGLCSFAGGRTCPKTHRDCPHARAGMPPPADGAA